MACAPDSKHNAIPITACSARSVETPGPGHQLRRVVLQAEDSLQELKKKLESIHTTKTDIYTRQKQVQPPGHPNPWAITAEPFREVGENWSDGA